MLPETLVTLIWTLLKSWSCAITSAAKPSTAINIALRTSIPPKSVRIIALGSAPPVVRWCSSIEYPASWLLAADLRVFRPRLLRNWSIRISILPEFEELLIRGLRLRIVPRECIGAAEPQIGQRRNRRIHHNPWMVQNLLKLRSSCVPLPVLKVRLSPHVNG